MRVLGHPAMARELQVSRVDLYTRRPEAEPIYECPATMQPPLPTSLFDQHPPPRRPLSGFMVSTVAHVLACTGIYFAFNPMYHLVPTVVPQRYGMRMVDLSSFPVEAPEQPEITRTKASQGSAESPPRMEAGSAAVAGDKAESQEEAAPEALAEARLPNDAILQQHAIQTMIVPDTTKQIAMVQPLPQVMMWNAPNPKVTVLRAPPQPPSLAAMMASLRPPNQEMEIADLKLSATTSPSTKMLPPPSNSSPLSSSNPEQVQLAIMRAQHAGEPTPTDVIVASNLQLQSVVTAVPVFNAVMPPAAAGSLHPGGEKGRATEGTGVAISARNGPGNENSRGMTASSGAAAAPTQGGRAPGRTGVANGPVADTGRGSAVSGGTGSAIPGPGFVVHGADAASGTPMGNDLETVPPQRMITRIKLSKDGKFDMVVVGNSTAEEYPETVALWHSRLTYSVYVQVGTAQRWVLQYAVPNSEVGSTVSRLDPPWPYDISRPSIDADAQQDAIIVHGLVNATGHFERLAVVFPEQLTEAAFLLKALETWEFRPALRNGQPAAVEVLLIIPPATE